MKIFLVALQFLTILPIRIKSKILPEDFGKSCLYFPIAGLLIGILLAIFLGLFSFLPPLVLCVLVVALEIILTAGLHLDGFADTCDGLSSFKSKEESLEVMRDSRIGTMAAVAIVLLLLLKVAILFSLEPRLLWKAIILMSVFARWAQALACLLGGSARQEGKGKYFIEYIRAKDVFIGAIFTLGLFFLLFKLKGLSLFLISIAPVFWWVNYIKQKFGGMTGDTIGSVNEIAELAVLLFVLVLM